MKTFRIMNGSEAIVRGAIESGARIISGYPGYPITAIMECAKVSRHPDLHG